MVGHNDFMEHAIERPLYKVSNDGTTAIDPYVGYYNMDTCPVGLKVQLYTIGGVTTHGTINEDTRHSFKGWRGVPNGGGNV